MVTLEYAQQQLDKWLAASAASAGAQEYRIADRMVKRAETQNILEMIRYWTRMVDKLTAQANGAGTDSFSVANFNWGCD